MDIQSKVANRGSGAISARLGFTHEARIWCQHSADYTGTLSEHIKIGVYNAPGEEIR
jgi:hypothetical protein